MATNEMKQEMVKTNPWKGLNFYKEGETLYGRDDEIQSLALYVINNIQTVLYGKSGIGKSSIINAGVFPIARREGLFPIPIRLKHDKDTSYIAQIKAAFLESGIGIKELLPAINEQEESLWEYLHRHLFFNVGTKEPVRSLIVLDQFEEIFTLQQNESKKKDFFSELADLLNEVIPQYIINANNDSSQRKDQKPESTNSAFVLDLGSNEAEETEEYLSESLFNIVFTIREDFLSYLERYTKFIPVMKSNRYALLPLNEEQAKDIIMKPMPGLVNIDVAKLIIEKVTGRTDFSLGDAPEIEVDAAVLSLYLSRLFIKKGESSEITAKLVDESSKDIIKDFYEESIYNLPVKDIEKIEDQLITYEGRRNNVSRNDLISEGVSETTIHTLVEDKKLLRQFSYQDDIRVEYMHDILCPIVNSRIEQREAARLQAEENAKVERHNRLIKLGIYTLIPLLLVSLGFIAYLIYANQKYMREKGLGFHQQFVISLSEDSLVTADNDFWKARLQVVAVYDTSRMILIDTLINKAVVSNTYTFSSDTSRVFHVNVKFGDNSRYQDIDTTYTIGQLTGNASIPLKIRFQEAKLITYSSSVVMDLDGKYKGLQDAIVVLRDKIQRTDDKGVFAFNLEDSLNSDDILYIIKKGFTSFEESDILEKGKLREKFVLSMADSLSYFDQRCAMYDSLSTWEYSTVKEKYPNGAKVTMAGGQADHIVWFAKTAGRTPDGKYKIEGYYYFVSEYNTLNQHGSEHHSYHLFTGWMDPIPLKTTNLPFKTFGLESYDVANNKQRINGKYWRSGLLSGEIVGYNSLIGEFGGDVTK